MSRRRTRYIYAERTRYQPPGGCQYGPVAKQTRHTVFRPHTGEWFILDREKNEIMKRQFGLPGDIPVLR